MKPRTLASLALPMLLLAWAVSYFFAKSGGQGTEFSQVPSPEASGWVRESGDSGVEARSRPVPDGNKIGQADLPSSVFERPTSTRPTERRGLPKTEKAIAEAFSAAIGPALARVLPAAQAEQIYDHFKTRVQQPLEPYTFLCWSEGTPTEVLEATHRSEDAIQRLITSELSTQAFQSIGSGRWSRTATDSNTGSFGTPVTLTWSFAPDGAITDNGQADDDEAPSNLIARLATLYASDGADTTRPPGEQPWFPLFTQAFADLSRETGLIFIYESEDDGAAMSNSNDGINGIRGDIRIFGKDIDGNSNVLAYNFSPGYGDMVIDTNDSFFTNKGNNSRRLRNMLGHEVGHGLGLGHVCPIDNTKLMEPFINLGFEGVRFDDVFSLQDRYGDHFERQLGSGENNDSPANATQLTPVPGTPLEITERLSLDSNTDSDVYRVDVDAGQLLIVTTTPSSDAYLEGTQLSDGSCSGGTPFDSSSYHDLALEVISSDGSTVLVTANSEGEGVAETISYSATSTGTCYVRVNGDSSPETQIYSLEVLIETPATTLTLTSSDLTVDESDLSDTATLFINSSEPAPADITVTLNYSGSAQPEDYSGNLTATIPAGGTVSNPIVITAEFDSEFEGTESLDLSLPGFTSGAVIYGTADPSSQSIQIADSPTPDLAIQSHTIVAESFSQQNGVADPDETLVLEVNLENNGSGSISTFTGTLTGPSGFTPFDAIANYTEIEASSSQAQTFTFALSGDCGDTLELVLNVSDGNGYSKAFPIDITLGEPGQNQIEDFENEGSLPAGWSTSSNGDGTEWAASSSRSTSDTYSAFADNVSSEGTSFLTSPAFDVGLEGATASFNHYFNTEFTWDGCALEISIDEGPWQDILDAGGSFMTGGYTTTLNVTQSYLSGRQAWTGNSATFMLTSLNLPTGLAGSSIRLRWVMACDPFVGDEGWFIDDVSLPTPLTCDTTGPALTLSAAETDLSEDDPSQSIAIVIACDPLLPTLKPVDFTLEFSGSADVSDISTLGPTVIPAGESSASYEISAVRDELIEGPETLTLGLVSTAETTEINITDTSYATWAFALGTGGSNLSDQDFDGDGSINIEEFAFGTIGDDPGSKPDIQPIQEGEIIKIPIPDGPLPDDLAVILETSTNLVDWSSDDVVVGLDFFEFPLSGGQTFFRFGYVTTP